MVELLKNTNMKKLFALLTGGLLSLSACTDLTPELYSDLTTSNAYTTEMDIDAALVGVYADLGPYPGDGWLYYCGYFVMLTDYTTDMGYSTAAGDPTKHSNFTYDASSIYFSNNWRTMFEVISNANVLLDKIENVEMDATKKVQVIAQAKFCRALAYRDATDGWGPVPLVTTFVDDPISMRDMPLTPVSEIDAFLVEELKYCIDNLPEKWTAEQGLSRATKGAAATLLGKIYMRAHNYTEAKKYIDMVLDMRDRGIYQLNPDFRNVWSESNKQDMGSIFCLLHESSQNGGEIALHFGPSDHPTVQNRWQYYAVSLEFWRKYDNEDPRKQFFYYNYTGASPRDESTDYGFYYMMPDKGQTTPPADTVKLLQNVATMKYTYEMVSESYYDGRTISIFRLADVILCKAEIENELNGPQAALPYLNEIRHRAGAPEYGVHPRFPVPGSKEAMAQAILDERGFELVFEFQRRPDLLRFGKYEETCNAYLQERGLTPRVTSSLRLFPYPLNDAKLNSQMATENSSRLP